MALYDRINFSLDYVKNYLKIPDDVVEDDVFLVDLIKSACDTAEKLCREFTEDEEIPEPVRMWVLKKIARDYEARLLGVKSEKLGDEQISYDTEDYKDLELYIKLPGL